MTHLVGDPADLMLRPEATEEQRQALRERLGLNDPILVQFGRFISGAVRGDFGESIWQRVPALPIVLDRLPATLYLTSATLLLAVPLSIVLGIISAIRPGSIVDRVVTVVSLGGVSTADFWLGLMLILFFSVRLGWLPAGQSTGFSSLVLPAVTLSTLPMAQIARLTRSGMSEVLGETFVSASHARGIPRWRIILVHAFRNASLPVITIIGLQAGTLLSGAITVEFVFAWPGLGTLATQAVQTRDFSLIQAIVVFGAVVFVLINLLVDLLYGILDPRIRDGVA